MAEGICLDTSVYIQALRQNQNDALKQRNIFAESRAANFHPLWLSAVVLEELYAGASDARAKKSLIKFENDFAKVGRLFVPNRTDWRVAGQILNQIGAKYGYEKIGRARLTNDALLAASAARLGLTLLTANQKDFELIAKFRRFKWKAI